MANKLTPKQKAFADYYIETGNATIAYKKAGYSVKSDNAAAVEGSKLLRNPKVKKYIEERMKELESKRIASQEEILQFLTSVMRGEVTEEIPVGKGEGYFELEDKTPSVKDRVKAAELLGKRYMLWTEKQQVEVITPVFIDDVPEED
jgi:phage terminase small subunit